jgi:hypothetical protein
MGYRFIRKAISWLVNFLNSCLILPQYRVSLIYRARVVFLPLDIKWLLTDILTVLNFRKIRLDEPIPVAPRSKA